MPVLGGKVCFLDAAERRILISNSLCYFVFFLNWGIETMNIFKIFIHLPLFCVYWCFAYIYVYVKVSDLGVTVVRLHVGARIWTQVFQKNSQCPQSLNHLSSPGTIINIEIEYRTVLIISSYLVLCFFFLIDYCSGIIYSLYPLSIVNKLTFFSDCVFLFLAFCRWGVVGGSVP